MGRYWFVHITQNSVEKDCYAVMSERSASSTSGGHESWLRYVGHKLTTTLFDSEKDVVEYAERLLKQDNLPDVVRTRLKAFVDKFYNGTAYILDSLDNEYQPHR
ncbi:MAG: hypothetical protein Q8P36_02025 [bacterium]|nr:hypothetical protein [bacterium]